MHSIEETIEMETGQVRASIAIFQSLFLRDMMMVAFLSVALWKLKSSPFWNCNETKYLRTVFGSVSLDTGVEIVFTLSLPPL